jgi:hypothetical protein
VELLDSTRDVLQKKEFKRSQYQFMAARLKGNQVTFEGHVKVMDDAISASKKELAGTWSL